MYYKYFHWSPNHEVSCQLTLNSTRRNLVYPIESAYKKDKGTLFQFHFFQNLVLLKFLPSIFRV